MTEDIRIYVISLREHNPRRADLFERLGKAAFQAEVVDAVDGRERLDLSWESEYCRRGQVRKFGRPLTDTEIACALSHREVYRRFLETPAEFALVIEDDAIFDGRLDAFVRNGGYRLAPMVMPYHNNTYVYDDPAPLEGTGAVARKICGSVTGGTCYSLNRGMAQAMIRANSPVCFTADFPVDMTTVDCAVAVPRIVDHPSPGQDKSQVGWSPYRKTLRFKLRRLFTPGYPGRWWRKRIGHLRGRKT